MNDTESDLDALLEQTGKLSSTVTAECTACHTVFTTHLFNFCGKIITPSGCPDCANLRDDRIAEWVKICPMEFRIPIEAGGNTDLRRMDADCPNWRQALNWKFGCRGLMLRGDSGRCKTRAMWRLVRRLFDERHKVIALTSAKFDRECRDAAGSFTLSAWFDRLATVDVLFLDDLGKANWTQATEAQIFDLIDQRTREGRPILATSNDTGASLAARLSDDRGAPLVRRLRDYCECLVF